jgi:hypothetical protein
MDRIGLTGTAMAVPEYVAAHRPTLPSLEQVLCAVRDGRRATLSSPAHRPTHTAGGQKEDDRALARMLGLAVILGASIWVWIIFLLI